MSSHFGATDSWSQPHPGPAAPPPIRGKASGPLTSGSMVLKWVLCEKTWGKRRFYNDAPLSGVKRALDPVRGVGSSRRAHRPRPEPAESPCPSLWLFRNSPRSHTPPAPMRCRRLLLAGPKAGSGGLGLWAPAPPPAWHLVTQTVSLRVTTPGQGVPQAAWAGRTHSPSSFSN